MILKWARVLYLYTGSRTILCFKTLGKKSGFGEERVEPRTTTAVPIDPGNAELFPANVRLLSCRVS